MTIKTLEYIHTLLLLDKAALYDKSVVANKLVMELEESDKRDEELIRSKKMHAIACAKAHIASEAALREFEATEW